MGIRDFGLSYLLFSVLHLVLFALAVAVCGLYGTDVHHANEKNVHSDGKWVSPLVSTRGIAD